MDCSTFTDKQLNIIRNSIWGEALSVHANGRTEDAEIMFQFAHALFEELGRREQCRENGQDGGVRA
jgi:hypothetical protein